MAYKIRIFLKILILLLFLSSSVYALNANLIYSNNSLKKQAIISQPSDSLVVRYDSKGHIPIFISANTPNYSSKEDCIFQLNSRAPGDSICHYREVKI
jgi:hypothetical protein